MAVLKKEHHDLLKKQLDESLYNCSTIFLHSRCSRCEALEKLRLWRIEYEYKQLKAQLASA